MATTFNVSHGGIRIRVKLLPTVADVHRSHQHGCKRDMSGKAARAFFLPTQSPTAKYIGTVVLPLARADLRELVPHEVAHAVIHAQNGVLSHDDEACCTAIGIISARIHKRIEQLRGEV